MKFDLRVFGIVLSMVIITALAIDYNKKINNFNSSYIKSLDSLYHLKQNIFEHKSIINEAILKLYFNNDRITKNYKEFKEIRNELKTDSNIKDNYPDTYKQILNIIKSQENIIEDTNEFIKRNSRVKNSLSILYNNLKHNNIKDQNYYDYFVKFLTSSMYQQNNFLEEYKSQKELFEYFKNSKDEKESYHLNFLHINVLYTQIPILKKLIINIENNYAFSSIKKSILNFEKSATKHKTKIQDKFYIILAGTILFFTIILILIKNIKTHLEELRYKDKLIYNQSKHAAMGEMIDAIAHQWNQPINVLKMRTELLTVMKDDDEIVPREEIDEYQEKVNEQLDHMVNTLNEFRNFLRPNKTTKPFSVEKSIKGVLVLLNDELIKNQIIPTVNTKNDFEIDGIENEFKHVLINLINNSKDAFVEFKIPKRTITITIDKNTILIEDNAGGIPPNLIKRIFEPNFTTKKEGKGTGIGLYMTKQILDKIGASINAKNTDNGVCFTISLEQK